MIALGSNCNYALEIALNAVINNHRRHWNLTKHYAKIKSIRLNPILFTGLCYWVVQDPKQRKAI